jgi:hypothetical protein
VSAHLGGHTLRPTPPAGSTSSTTSLVALPPLRCLLRATARASAPSASASLTPSSGLPTSSRAGNSEMEPYARLKGQLRYSTHGPALRLHLKRPHNYRPIPHLDPALRARLQSALQRPDLKPTTRAKIEAAPGRKNEPQETLCPK